MDYSPWTSWPVLLGGLGSLASLGNNIYSAVQGSHEADRVRTLNQQMQQAAQAPLPVNDYYKPLSDVAANALRRGMTANMGERGIQPGGYYDSMVAQLMAKTENERYMQALQAAANARQLQLQGLAGYKQPQLPGPMGGLGGLGTALQWYQTQRTNDNMVNQLAALRRSFTNPYTTGQADTAALNSDWSSMLGNFYNRDGSGPQTTGQTGSFAAPNWSWGEVKPAVSTEPMGSYTEIPTGATSWEMGMR